MWKLAILPGLLQDFCIAISGNVKMLSKVKYPLALQDLLRIGSKRSKAFEQRHLALFRSASPQSFPQAPRGADLLVTSVCDDILSQFMTDRFRNLGLDLAR